MRTHESSDNNFHITAPDQERIAYYMYCELQKAYSKYCKKHYDDVWDLPTSALLGRISNSDRQFSYLLDLYHVFNGPDAFELTGSPKSFDKIFNPK